MQSVPNDVRLSNDDNAGAKDAEPALLSVDSDASGMPNDTENTGPRTPSLILTPSPKKPNQTDDDAKLTPPKVSPPQGNHANVAALFPGVYYPPFVSSSDSDSDGEQDVPSSGFFEGSESESSFDSDATEPFDSSTAYAQLLISQPDAEADGHQSSEFDDLGLWCCPYCGRRASESCCLACMIESNPLPPECDVPEIASEQFTPEPFDSLSGSADSS